MYLGFPGITWKINRKAVKPIVIFEIPGFKFYNIVRFSASLLLKSFTSGTNIYSILFLLQMHESRVYRLCNLLKAKS